MMTPNDPQVQLSKDNERLFDAVVKSNVQIYQLKKRIAELEAQLAISKQEWIFPADRLPALDQQTIGNVVTSVDVLVCLKIGGVGINRLEGLKDSGVSWWGKCGYPVRAWMPLPEALK